jgi:uncharacterized membrane protein
VTVDLHVISNIQQLCFVSDFNGLFAAACADVDAAVRVVVLVVVVGGGGGISGGGGGGGVVGGGDDCGGDCSGGGYGDVSCGGCGGGGVGDGGVVVVVVVSTMTITSIVAILRQERMLPHSVQFIILQETFQCVGVTEFL